MVADELRVMIWETLYPLRLWSRDAEELLLLTCAVESDFGKYRRQIRGPARGIFQIEPATFDWLKEKYLKRVPQISEAQCDDMVSDDRLAIIMCRLRYLAVPDPLPDADDPFALASYWKQHYNTPKGKGTVQKAIQKYRGYVG